MNPGGELISVSRTRMSLVIYRVTLQIGCSLGRGELEINFPLKMCLSVLMHQEDNFEKDPQICYFLSVTRM